MKVILLVENVTINLQNTSLIYGPNFKKKTSPKEDKPIDL
jgi:hypothetical protein